MIENYGQLLSAMAKKAGIPENNTALIEALSHAELTKIPVHSDLVKGLDENLLSVNAAIDKHPAVMNAYKAQLLGTFDTDMAATIDKLPIEDSEKARLKAIPSTYNRHKAVGEAMEQIQAKLVSDASKGKNTEALQAQVDKLQADLRDKAKNEVKLQEDYDNRLAKEKQTFVLRGKLLNIKDKKTQWDSLDEDLKFDTLNNILQRKMSTEGVKMIFNDKGLPELIKEDGTKYYGPNNSLIGIDDLIETAIAEKKGFIVSEPPKPAASSGQPPAFIPGGGNPGPLGGNQTASDGFMSNFYEQAAQQAATAES